MQAVVAEATEAAAMPVDAAAATPVDDAVTSAEAAGAAAGAGVGQVVTAAEPNAGDVETAAAPGSPESGPFETGPIETGPIASAPPAALRADAPGHAALDGIDLDVFADAVAQKILHRLTDARIDAIVSERVLEIAERLVREEIDRIKADAQ
jgi:hypothetical protein